MDQKRFKKYLPMLFTLAQFVFSATSFAEESIIKRPPPLPSVKPTPSMQIPTKSPPPLPKVRPPGANTAPSLPRAPSLPKAPGGGGSGGTAPGLPGRCVSPGSMPVTPDTCQILQTMCGCEKFPHDPKKKRNRRSIPKEQLQTFPKAAPGIEHFSRLGYCTGVSSGSIKSFSTSGQSSSTGGVRKYTLRLKSAVEPKTGRGYLKTIMEDQVDENDQLKMCGTLSQIEKGITSMNRPMNAPPLFFVEGETAEITVINDSAPGDKNSTSIHWHGIILPNDQDGIADITQAPIPPGGKKVYRFNVQHNGTYWYHPHDFNEQDTRGAFIILPNPETEARTNKEYGGVGVRYHHDRVILLSDYKERKTKTIINYLRGEDRNAYETDSGIHKGWLSQLKCAKEYLENFKAMKMFWMDRADVWYDSFFMNDETCLNCGSKTEKVENLHTEYPGQKFQRLNEFSSIKPGERVRLRIINGSASTYFFLDYANSSSLAPSQKLDMIVVAKDGLAIRPMYVDQLYMGMGETYDIIVDVPDDGTLYEFRAKSIDDVNSKRIARTLIGNNPLDERESTKVVSARDVPVQICGPYPEENDQIKQISYDQLLAPQNRVTARPDELRPFEVYQKDKPIARYNLKLSGSMEDYHWKINGMNGTKLKQDSMNMLYMDIKEDYRIRVTIENDMILGMMNHPWHLHGNWFRIINEGESDADIAKKALLHTATIYPGQKMTLEFYADPEYRGAWMFHCHNLYHMANDMMMYLRYDTINEDYMNHMNGRHNHKKSWVPGAIAGMKNQYIELGAGATVGTDGMGPTGQLRYKGTVGKNLGFIDFNLDIAAKNKKGKTDLEVSSRLRHCFAVDKCVFLDFDLRSAHDGEKEYAQYAGGQYKIWNSDLLVVEAGAGAVCHENPENKSINCSPGLKANVGSKVDVGWNTKVSGKIGCEGEYCKDFFASLKASVTPVPWFTIVPAHCILSTNRDETGCLAEVKIITDPIPVGRSH